MVRVGGGGLRNHRRSDASRLCRTGGDTNRSSSLTDLLKTVIFLHDDFGITGSLTLTRTRLAIDWEVEIVGDATKRIWVYFPFKDIEHDPTMPSNAKRYREKYKNFQGVLMRDDSLGNVQNDDMLIVAAHGLPGNSNQIAVSVLNPDVSTMEKAARILTNRPPATMFDTIEANDLADLIKKNGLDLGHKRIKFITCGGAGMGVIDPDSVKWKSGKGATIAGSTIGDVTGADFAQLKHNTDCFAAVFARAMHKRDYLQLRVRAYPGFVNAQALQKIITLEFSGKGYELNHEVYNESANWGLGGFEQKRTWEERVGDIPSKAIEKFWFDGTGQRVTEV